MVERGGRVQPKIIDNRGTRAIHGAVKTHVLPSSFLFTDEGTPIRPSPRATRATGGSSTWPASTSTATPHTNTVKGFFRLFKNSIRAHQAISTEYLQNYLDKHAFRYNRRHSSQPMFWAMLDRVQEPRLAAA